MATVSPLRIMTYSRLLSRGLPTAALTALALLLPSVATATPTAYGGPDSYGYYYADSTVSGGPSYDSTIFTTAVSSGTELTTADSADDTSQALTLPFSFTFYGTSYSTAYVCSNGYISFTSTCSLSNNTFASNTYSMIAPFWDDLDNRGTGTSYIYYYTSGSSPNRVLNVVWIDTTHYAYTAAYGNISFAVQLKETSNNIVLQYKDVTLEGTGGTSYSAGLSATSGIDQGSTSGYYLQYNYNSAQLTGSSAVEFTPSVTVVAEANGPYTATEGGTATISASGSTTSGVTYAYDCTNDGTYETTGSSASSYACTYSDDGTYTAKVKVTNSVYGATTTDTATVTVANAAPTPVSWYVDGYSTGSYSISGGYAYYTFYADEGDTLTGGGSATDVAADTVTITQDWGDGTIDTAASGTYITHEYADDGTYTLSVEASDEDGGTTDFSAYGGLYVDWSIANVDPEIVLANEWAGTESVATSFAASAADAGTADVLTYAWSFGDGSTGSGDATTHLYADAGTYTWSLTVTDDDGGSVTTGGTTTVTDELPTISAATYGSTTEGSSASFSATASAGASDTLTYAWSFGDGSTGTGASPSHTYADDGSYTVTLTVTDDDGNTTSTSGTSTITNVAPTLGAVSVTGATEGSVATLTTSAVDPGSETLTYFWTFGDGSTDTTTTASTTHTYVDDGTYSVTVLVMDGDGGTDTDTVSVAVANAAPVFTSSSIPSSGSEGGSVSGSAAATDAGTTDVITYTWDWGDGTTSTGAAVTHSYQNDGTYLVQVTAADADGGSTTRTGYATIAGVAPVIGSHSSVGTLDEGASSSFSAVATDAGVLDTLTYTWDWDDGTSSTGDAVSHAWGDNGTYLVTLTVTDEDGLADSDTFVVTVDNVAPTAGAISAVAGDEGVSQTVTVAVADPGSLDTFSYEWDFGDGTTGTGSAPSHAWPDEGTYTITVSVKDDDGGTAAAVTTTVDIANVDPVISGSPDTTADESVAWSYAPTAVDVAADTLTWSLSAAPAGMTVDAATGALAWTPTWADSRTPVAVTLDVSDGDGGYGSQSFTVEVTAIDSDGDGMPDGFEDAYGLDKGDASDAGGDLDADGISNGDEFTAGSDPSGFDGPTAPILVAPVGGEYTSTVTPDLEIGDATSNRGYALTYEVEVYADAGLTSLVTSVADLPDVDGDEVWTVDVSLTDNTRYYWRARANDGLVDGPWATSEDFYTNTAEDAPSTPVLFQPIDGEVATSVTPDLIWTTALDPDGTAVSYDVQVWDAAGTTLVTEVAGVTDDTLDAYGDWIVDVALTEDTVYTWTARAVDGSGSTSPWAEPESFLVSSENAAPSDVAWISPTDGASLVELSPVLSWSTSTDPEGTSVSYRVESAVDAGFTGAIGADVDGTTLDLAATGAALQENTTNYLRVRSTDADGVSSSWSVISVFVRGENEAPTAPTLTAPVDGDEVSTPKFTFGGSTDPEGDAITYTVQVSKSADMSSAITSGALDVTDGAGSWDAGDALAAGDWYWTVVATDSEGASTAAEPWAFTLATDGGNGQGSGTPTDGGGCNCDASGGTAAGLAAGLIGFVLALRRRRV